MSLLHYPKLHVLRNQALLVSIKNLTRPDTPAHCTNRLFSVCRGQARSLELSSQLEDPRNVKVLATTKRLLSQTLRPYTDPKLSYAYGRSQDHLLYSTVIKELDQRIETSGDVPAFAFQSENKVVSLREFDQDVNKLSKALVTKFGVSRGDFVAVYSYNCYNWLVVQFACTRIGAVVVPINPSNKAKELSHVLRAAHPKCIFSQGPKSVQADLNPHLQILKSDEVSDTMDEIGLRSIILMDAPAGCDYDASSKELHVSKTRLYNWSDCLNEGRVFRSLNEATNAGVSQDDAYVMSGDSTSPDDLFAVYFTSGTTGVPKGACVSHFGALNNAKICFNRMLHGLAKNEKPVVATTLPFFHIYAGVLLAFCPLIDDCTMINSSHKYDVKMMLQSIVDHKANITALTPTILIDMLAHVDVNGLGEEVPLKRIQSGGAYLQPEVVTRAFRLLKNLKEVKIGYGSTENAAVATLQCIHEPDKTKANSVGGPIDFTEVRIVDPVTEKLVPHGEQGEVQTRGHNIMLGYLKQPEKTAEVITPHRWYRTGDIGVMYPHGSIRIVGRHKSMIIRGGENIYPEEVSNMIIQLPYVENVHVVGVPHKRYGEQVCAWIKLKPGYSEASSSAEPGGKQITKEEIIDFCKANMTHFKVPEHILFVDSFPMTPTKKAQAHIMAQESIKLLNLET